MDVPREAARGPGAGGHQPPRARGFTLVELLLVVALLMLVVVTGAHTIHSQSRPDSLAVAKIIAQELYSLRQRAMASRTPAALAIPRERAASDHAQAYYILEGEARPEVTRVVSLREEFPRVRLVCVWWDLDPGKLSDPARGNSTAPPDTGGEADRFGVAEWAGPFGEDYVFLFAPDGGLCTNGLYQFDGAFHLVVCEGISTSMGADLHHQLRKVWSPATVTLGSVGAVTVQDGLLAASDGLVQVGELPPPMEPPVDPPVVPAQTNLSPATVRIDVTPAPNSDTLSPDQEASVAVERYLTLTVEATDPEGDPLSVSWGSEPLESGPPGAFSTSKARMEWSGAAWIATSSWSPPPTAEPGARFRLCVEVEDGRGGRVSRCIGYDATPSGIVKVIPGERIYALRPSPAPGVVVSMNIDGTAIEPVPGTEGAVGRPAVSPDGRLVAWAVSDGTLQLANADGSEARTLHAGLPGQTRNPSFSPDGTQVVYRAADGPEPFPSNLDIFRVGADGAGRTRLVDDAWMDDAPVWAADGRIWWHALKPPPFDQSNQIWDMSSAGTQAACRTGGDPGYFDVPAPNQGGNRVAFGTYAWPPTSQDIGVMNRDGTGRTLLAADPSLNEHSPSWSPRGDRILYVSVPSTLNSFSGEVWSMKPDGSEPSRITPAGDYLYEGPTWSIPR